MIFKNYKLDYQGLLELIALNSASHSVRQQVC